VDDPNVTSIFPGTKVYELTWLQKSINSDMVIFRKWRVFVDTPTNLPRRTEWYSKLKPDDEYRFQTCEVVTYPSESEIKVLLSDIFGPDDGQPGEPEYMGTPEPSGSGTPRKK